jgi:hypothetical protein
LGLGSHMDVVSTHMPVNPTQINLSNRLRVDPEKTRLAPKTHAS